MRRFFVPVASALLFLVVTSTIILSAYGFKLDFHDYTLVQTSIIHLQDKIDDVSVYLDGSLVANKLPVKIFEVSLGYHEIVIDKPGFYRWYRRVLVQPDLVSLIHGTLLVPTAVALKSAVLLAPVDRYTASPEGDFFVTFAEVFKELKVFRGFDRPSLVYNLPPDSNLIDWHWLDNDRLSVNFANHQQIDNVVLWPDRASEVRSFLSEYQSLYYDPDLAQAYFLSANNLYTFNPDEPEKPQLMLSFAGDYQIDHGWLWALSDTIIWQVDLFSSEKKQLGKINLPAKNFTVYYTPTSTVILFLFDTGQLYAFDRTLAEKQWDLVDDQVTSLSALSPDELLVYSRGYEIKSADFRSGIKQFITRFSQPVSAVSFAVNHENILFKQGQSVMMCDIKGANCQVFAKSEAGQAVDYLAEIKGFLWLADKALLFLPGNFN